MKYSIFEVWFDEAGNEERDLREAELNEEQAHQSICMYRCLYPHNNFVQEEEPSDDKDLEQCVRCLRLDPVELLIKKDDGRRYCECCYSELFDHIWDGQFKTREEKEAKETKEIFSNYKANVEKQFNK